MNHLFEPDRLSVEHRALLHDAAKARAHRLRQQAIADFWQLIADGMEAQQLRARRAAERFAHRLARHDKLRSAAANRTAEDCC